MKNLADSRKSCTFASLRHYNNAKLSILCETDNKINKKMNKMTQAGYKPKTTLDAVYKALPPVQKAPKQLFVERMAEACKCSCQTIRMWLQGTQMPLPLVQETLVDAMVKYGYIESRESIDLNNFFPKQRQQA